MAFRAPGVDWGRSVRAVRRTAVYMGLIIALAV
jgi:hypothetical protein